MRLQDSEVVMAQVDGPRRHVYIKFRYYYGMQETIMSTNGHGEFRHTNGVISKVRIEAAGLGIRRVRIENIPPEVPDRAVRMRLNRYGEVKEVLEENWSRAYPYPVANGIRIAVVNLSQHIPSHVLIAGYRTLISYEGQPTTCYGCNGTGHLYHDCPRRRKKREKANANRTTSWADVAARGSGTSTADSEDMEVEAVAAEVATPVALLMENDISIFPGEIKRPSREENKHTEEDLQVGEDKREDTGSRDYAITWWTE